jgi:tetratricopeptide (TPR) repeat protein
MTRYPVNILILLLSLLLLSGCAARQSESMVAETGEPERHRRPMNEQAYHHFTNAVIYEQERLYGDAVTEYEQALAYEPMSYDIRMALGELQYRLQNPEEALNVLLPIQNKQAETYQLIGDSYRELNRVALARSAYEKALALEPDDVELNYQLSLWEASEGDLQAALEHLKKAAWESRAPDLFAQTAQTYSGIGMFDSAVVYLESAIDLGGGDPATYGQLAFNYLQSDRQQEAETTIREAVGLFPEQPRLQAQLLDIYNDQGRVDSVVAIAERILGLQSSDYRVYERVGQQLINLEVRDLAERCFEQALASYEKSTVSHFYLGRFALERDSLARAAEHFENLTELEPELPDGWMNYALIRSEQGSDDDAVEILNRALNHVRVDRDAVRFYLAQLLTDSNKYDSAIVVLRSAILEGGDTVSALFNIAAAFEQSGRFDRSVETFELLLDENPNHAQSLNYLGYMFADRNVRLQESLELIRRALALDSDNGAFLDSYAWVLYRLGRYQESLEQIEKAVELMPDDPIVTEHLGDIHYALGNVDKASEAWREALTLDPDNEALRQKLSSAAER